jgi:outer membrane lipopolysaccharide assembly protein LptE/RlpB
MVIKTNYLSVKIMVLMMGLVVFGCSYKFSGSGKLPSGVDSLYVNVFTNKSSESGWEARFASELISELTRSGIKTVSDKETAKSLLYGHIKSIASSAISHSGDSATLEQRLTATLDVKITDRDGDILWERNSLVRKKE